MIQIKTRIIAVFGVCAAVAHACGATIEYTVTDLGTLGGPTSAAWAVSQNGIIVGNSELYVAGSSGVVRENHPCIFQAGGQVQDLGLLDPVNGRVGVATSVNCQRQVVGWSDSPGVNNSAASDTANAFLYNVGGPLIDLGTPGQGQESFAYGINASGQITGYGQTATGAWHGFLWTVSGTTVSTVDLGAGFLGWAINDQGIIGGVDTKTQQAAIYNISSGSMTDIGPPGANGSQVSGMSARGFVAGSWGTGTNDDGFLYDINTGVLTDLKNPLSSSWSCVPSGVNDLGQVVGGYALDANFAAGTAFIYTSAGGMQNLNDLIDPSPGFYLQAAMGISNSGGIVGEGFNAAGQNDAFLLTPVPEPSTLGPTIIALAIAAIRLGWARLAKKTLASIEP
jgi:probable HAF family extracellular repeat protein